MSRTLAALGDALRRAKRQRRLLIRRGALVAAGMATLGLTIAFPPAPRLVWNASASAPVGLYAVAPGAAVRPGDMVLARMPSGWRRFAAMRRYLPGNVPLVKRIAAGPGDEVCALGSRIFINGAPTAERLARDGADRVMPRWEGCRRLGDDDIFLLMTASPASFDGRYFGISKRSNIIGSARLIWRR